MCLQVYHKHEIGLKRILNSDKSDILIESIKIIQEFKYRWSSTKNIVLILPKKKLIQFHAVSELNAYIILILSIKISIKQSTYKMLKTSKIYLNVILAFSCIYDELKFDAIDSTEDSRALTQRIVFELGAIDRSII